MANFYFTFGQNHSTRSGLPMKDRWVRVVAENADEARDLFIREFTSQFMPEDDKFAFQYTAQEFRYSKHHYRLGEYLCIEPPSFDQPATQL